ncbi:hypothetical protein LH47_00166 [Anoxybacillus thermarum]|uniref:Uncharacterized protein n=1 Tax=Anoxybacillus thermarum TaxID=404937 RepID=A0A0D0S271_9BACL|nr:hypothetical protein [Anoxybacillus thermarum]KIQ95735.1 hypothetical protein LH47_00166 [Anoxybacillus thermarum]
MVVILRHVYLNLSRYAQELNLNRLTDKGIIKTPFEYNFDLCLWEAECHFEDGDNYFLSLKNNNYFLDPSNRNICEKSGMMYSVFCQCTSNQSGTNVLDHIDMIDFSTFSPSGEKGAPSVFYLTDVFICLRLVLRVRKNKVRNPFIITLEWIDPQETHYVTDRWIDPIKYDEIIKLEPKLAIDSSTMRTGEWATRILINNIFLGEVKYKIFHLNYSERQLGFR